MLEELVAHLSVGALRKPLVLSEGKGPLGSALAELTELSPESRLLGATAMLCQYRRCGRVPSASEGIPKPADEDSRVACSSRAGELLTLILAMTNTSIKERLIEQWLSLAQTGPRRPPYALLPALLDYGAAHRPARSTIGEVAGPRGAWLMRQNPRWQFTAGQGEDPRTIFSTGKIEQRVAAIRQLRLTDPGPARELIASTWKEDSADERAAFIEAMLVSLGGDDEAFLESALDDRSKQVRAAAADLLARLTDSAYVKRMIERAAAFLNCRMERSFVIGKKQPAMEISLPGETFDPSWTRDGLTEKPEEKIGRRQWWLKQVIARVPPVSWSARWGIEPLACVNAAKGEFADIVRSAWIEAVARHPDPKWIAALLASAGDGELGPQAIGLLNLLPLAAQQAQAAAILDKPAIPIDTVWRLLSLTRFPLDRDGTRALCRRMERHVGASTAAYDPTLRQVLTEAAVRILPEVYEEISGRWVGPQWEPHRKALDEFFLHLRIRFDLQREF